MAPLGWLLALLFAAPMAHADCPVPDFNNPDCVIQPPAERDANPSAMSVPTVMQPGRYYPVSVTFRNTGAATWTAGDGYKLGSAGPQDNWTWGLSRVAVPGAIGPQQEATFHFTVRAPDTPGRYTFQWRMLMEGVEWFGPSTSGVWVDVYAGSISASPATCTIPWGANACYTTVSWSSNAPNAKVWYSLPDGSLMTQWASGQNGSAVGGIDTRGLRFHLKSGDLTLATVDASAVPTHNSAPSVALTGPGNNHVYQIGSAVAFTANASDSDDGVQRVEFLIDGVKMGQDTSAPYELHWTGTDGGHSLVARAFDTRGYHTDSAAMWIAANGLPNIALTSPVNGARTTEPASFLLKADASDVDGVQRVEFYANNVLVASDTVAPYEATWSGAGVGTHALHAVAYDVMGASKRSATSSVGVDRLVTGPAGLSRRWVYDAQQRLCKTIDPEAGATVIEYDEVGNVAWSAAGLNLPDPSSCNRTEAAGSGRAVGRSYDGRDRLQALSFPDGRGNQTWEYYADGLPKTVTTSNEAAGQGVVVNTYHYDKRRHLTAEAQAQPGWYSWSSGYGYEPDGHLRWHSYPTGAVIDYAPNALGQPRQVVTSAQTYASNVRYYPNGAISQFTYGNGIVHTMSQNARQLPERSVSAGVLDLRTGYDHVGNVVEIRDLVRGDTYSRWMAYDGLDRLIAAGSCSFGGDCWHRYTYDALNNLKTWSLGGIKDHRYYYDAGNRLTNIQNASGASVIGLGYDPQGNLDNKNGQAYVFDYGNRLRQVTGKEAYRYDALGRRVMSASADWATVRRLSMYNKAGQMIYTEAGNPRKSLEHYYLGESLLAIREIDFSPGVPAVVRYQHTDALGSPVAVTDAAGAVVERTDWEPYGAAIGKPNYDGVGYTGHVMDGASGLTYMQQRYYDEDVGRFLSVDPVTVDTATGFNFNRYGYGNNNPYRFTDPDGRQSEENDKHSVCENGGGYCGERFVAEASDAIMKPLIAGHGAFVRAVEATAAAINDNVGVKFELSGGAVVAGSLTQNLFTSWEGDVSIERGAVGGLQGGLYLENKNPLTLDMPFSTPLDFSSGFSVGAIVGGGVDVDFKGSTAEVKFKGGLSFGAKGKPFSIGTKVLEWNKSPKTK
ncbi:hypothetical protein DX914_12540 [Lysobacter silvisoli]|uniref:Uncharacterized protein n=1 Tax=Lysobacter silvisoli TaxID=2293254 RepID=A0A371JZK0_9GAMM|nr:hypothetical protein DX914_12540 [Lysobacter silvisoli]